MLVFAKYAARTWLSWRFTRGCTSVLSEKPTKHRRNYELQLNLHICYMSLRKSPNLMGLLVLTRILSFKMLIFWLSFILYSTWYGRILRGGVHLPRTFLHLPWKVMHLPLGKLFVPQNTTQKSISIVFSVISIRHDSSLSKYRKQKQSPPGNTKKWCTCCTEWQIMTNNAYPKTMEQGW